MWFADFRPSCWPTLLPNCLCWNSTDTTGQGKGLVFSCSCVCPSAKYYVRQANFQHINLKAENMQILYSKQLKSGLFVTIMHFDQFFCSIWQYFPQQEVFFLRLSSSAPWVFVFPQQWLAKSCLCLWLCVSIMIKSLLRKPRPGVP